MQFTKEELKQLKNKVERIPAFEEKIGARLENISFGFNEPYLSIYGDFFMDDLNNFDKYEYIEIVATIYDEDNDIMISDNTAIFKDQFLGFQTFEIAIYGPTLDWKSIQKIRIYLHTH